MITVIPLWVLWICHHDSFFLQPSDPDLATERDVFMYRAYLALQKFVIVKDEIGANSPQLIQPLKVILTQFIYSQTDI